MLAQFHPKSLPTNLLTKDWWSKREIYNIEYTEGFMDRIHEFEVREDDIWIVTLPKCGTTWMQEMVWLLVNNCDFETAKKVPLELRSPFVEFVDMVGEDNDFSFSAFGKLKSPRVLKSHLPLPLLPKQIWSKKPKVIYVYRNPLDSLVSLYYFGQNFGEYMDKTVNECMEEKLNEELRTKSNFKHAIEFFKLRNEPWVHYTSFERMKRDLKSELNDVCKFLNITLTAENEKRLLKHLSFEEMKNNPQCNHGYEIKKFHENCSSVENFKDNEFMRKGKVGGYKEELSPELIAKLDKWIVEDLKPYNLTLNDLLLL